MAMKICPDKPEQEDLAFWIGKCDEGMDKDPVKKQTAVTFADRMKLFEEHSILGFNEGLMAVQKVKDLDMFYKLPGGASMEEFRDNAPKVGFVNATGSLVIPCIYEDPDFYTMVMGYRFSDGYAAVIKRFSEGSKEGMWYVGSTKDDEPISWGWIYVDKNGKETRNSYLDAHDFHEGLAAVVADDDMYWQFIDKKENIVIPQKFEWAGYFSDGLCLVKPDSTSIGYGYIDRTGKLVVPAIYPGGTPFKNGIAAVESTEHEFELALINKSGEMVGDYTFRPEYLSINEIKKYAINMFNDEKYSKCNMAILAHEKRRVEEHREEDYNTLGILPYIQGRIYYDGLGGFNIDYGKAFHAFSRGKESNALFMQAMCYYYGKGVDKDYAKAFELCNTAVKKNDWNKHGYIELNSGKHMYVLKKHITQGQGLYSLGIMHYYGQGTEVDYQKAMDCFVQSEKEGYTEAKQMIEKCRQKGWGDH